MYFDPDWIFENKPDKHQYPNITGLMDDKPKPPKKKKQPEVIESLADVFRPEVRAETPQLQIDTPINRIDPKKISTQTSQINYRELQADRQKQLEDYRNRLTYIKDNRTVHPITGQPLNPNRDLYSSYYDPESFRKVFEAAKQAGVDPWELLGTAFQETKVGGFRSKAEIAPPTNIGHVIDPEFDDVRNAYMKMALALDKANKTYKDRYREAGVTFDPSEEAARRIQVYNGLGMIGPGTESGYHGGTVKSFYGIPVTEDKPLNMLEDPIYGKVILDLARSLQQQPAIQEIYNQVYGTQNRN